MYPDDICTLCPRVYVLYRYISYIPIVINTNIYAVLRNCVAYTYIFEMRSLGDL